MQYPMRYLFIVLITSFLLTSFLLVSYAQDRVKSRRQDSVASRERESSMIG